jgi:hypothetical protein
MKNPVEAKGYTLVLEKILGQQAHILPEETLAMGIF